MSSEKFTKVSSLLILIVIAAGVSVWVWNGWLSDEKRESTGKVPTYANPSALQADSAYQEANPPEYEEYKDLEVPPLPPEQALQTFELEDGFRIELVAHEPQVINPVSMDVDADGRLWVVEMQSYMPVHDKSEEETSEMERVPESRVVVLDDTDGDGQIDNRRVFMDDLVLPRSIKVLDDGVLLAEPPRVWFIQDTTGDGIGDTKELVYNNYGNPGAENVEHMANGLMWGMDNWIHSAYSQVSFRRIDGQWKTRPFEEFAQWGITQDSWGRLYTTHNSRLLVSHLVPYGYSHRHPEFSLEAGINASIAESETMWPAHPTGVNRGYRVGEIVREDGTLLRSTSTTGPVIYRGEQFGEKYRGNAFVPEPAANLIKRLVGLDRHPGAIADTAKFAYEGKEFLTSTDERFRPVNLYNAPDGSIYVIDMYQGVLQHARFLTDHLRNYIEKHDLQKPEGASPFGRIYRIVRDDRPIDHHTPNLTGEEPGQLVEYLGHENGIIRDAAQQLLVQRSPADAIPLLEDAVKGEETRFYTRLQALWTLAGFSEKQYPQNRLYEVAQYALTDEHPRIRAAATRILEPALRQGNKETLNQLQQRAENETAPYPKLQLLASLGESSDSAAIQAMASILDEEVNSPYFREMALTGVYQREAELLHILRRDHGWQKGQSEQKDEMIKQLEGALTAPAASVQLEGEELRLYELGSRIFSSCMACHGNNGQGIEGVAPALNESRWVNSKDPAPLVRILLNGYAGSVDSTDSYPAVMPAHGYLSDEDAAAVLTYIRNAWDNSMSALTPQQVADIRDEVQDNRREWTEDELEERHLRDDR